ncbi:MAG: hypothetical protein KGM16_19815 [Bacteroidota bacterium]|nr:hypothetical protein [Bacteroidota bacterium]
MKEKLSKDKFDTECWANDNIRDPYQVIAELFSASDMFHLNNTIKKLMECCISPKMYQCKPPADVLLYSRIIHSAIKAADVLKEKQSSEIIIYENDLLNNKYFISHRVLHDDWTDFPRFLSRKEYCNPYLAFRKFFKYQSLDTWLTIWKNIVDGALCPEEARFSINELSVYIHLIKLVEAAHLIDVRETVHVRGRLKKRTVEGC